MAEHKKAIKSKDPLNGIAVHVQKTAHNINWQEARILARDNNWGKRRVLEALEIQQRRPMMNLDAGLLLDRSWTPFVRPRSGSHETGSVLVGSPNRFKGVAPKVPRLLKTTHGIQMSRFTRLFLNTPESKRIFPTLLLIIS